MLRHVVLLTLTDEAPDGQLQIILDELAKLPGIIPEIQEYTLGSDAGIAAGNADVVVVGDFASVADYEVYATNADHVAVIATHIKPWIADRRAVQFEI